MEQYKKLLQLIISLEGDVSKVFNKKNRSSGIRVRKRLQEVKAEAQVLRKEISTRMHEIEEERQIKLAAKKAKRGI